MLSARSLLARLPGGFAPTASPDARAVLADPRRAAEAFAGRMTDRQDLNPAERLLKACAWAQALATELASGPSPWRPHTDAAGSARIAFLVGEGVWVADTVVGLPVPALAAALGEAIAGHRVRPATGSLAATAVVAVDRRFLPAARAAWRRDWTEGPWIGMAHSTRLAYAPPLELLSASTAVLDAQGLAELAERTLVRADGLLRALPDGAFQGLGRELTRRCVDAWRPPEHASWDRARWPREEYAVEFVPGVAAVDAAALRSAVEHRAGGVPCTTAGVHSAMHVGLAAPIGPGRPAGLAVVANVRPGGIELGLSGAGGMTGPMLADTLGALAESIRR